MQSRMHFMPQAPKGAGIGSSGLKGAGEGRAERLWYHKIQRDQVKAKEGTLGAPNFRGSNLKGAGESKEGRLRCPKLRREQVKAEQSALMPQDPPLEATLCGLACA
eukprot:1133519-Pelagomonas_calceolata.AAC.3